MPENSLTSVARISESNQATEENEKMCEETVKSDEISSKILTDVCLKDEDSIIPSIKNNPNVIIILPGLVSDDVPPQDNASLLEPKATAEMHNSEAKPGTDNSSIV